MARAADLARVAPKYLGVPYATMDCQAFVEKCLKDIGIIRNLPGSNAWFREMTWVGTPEDCKKAFGCIPVGAFLFILKADGGEPDKYKPDGIGNALHIGIYTGMTGGEMVSMAEADGDTNNPYECNYGSGAIHSSSSRGKVCTSNFNGKTISGGWNRVGLWDELAYGLEDPIRPGADTEEKMAKEMITWANNDGPINLRSAKRTSSYLIDKIPQGETVMAESSDGGWTWIRWKGLAGYVMSKFLKDPNETQQDDGELVTVKLTKDEARALVSLGEKLQGKI